VRVRSEYSHALKVALAMASLACAMSLVNGCSSIKITNPGFFTTISTDGSTIRVSQQVQLKNNMSLTGSPLTFSVNGVARWQC
jgi:hypothetical protein